MKKNCFHNEQLEDNYMINKKDEKWWLALNYSRFSAMVLMSICFIWGALVKTWWMFIMIPISCIVAYFWEKFLE